MSTTEQEASSKSTSTPNTEDGQGEGSPPFDLDLAIDKIDDLLREEQKKSKYGLKPLSSGERAELRRTRTAHPFTPTLWRVLFEINHEEAPRWWLHQEDVSDNEWERRWVTLLRAMTMCQGQHNPNVRLGTVLALKNVRWAEMRFVRLMEAEGRELRTQVRYMAEYLASKGEAFNWTDVGKLLFFQDGDTAQNIRIGISRSYYGRKQMLKQESDQD